MSLPVGVLGIVVACYLIGGIPFGYLAGWLKGIDIRTVGSGNIGATNVGRMLGRPWGIACFVLDVLKGLLPMLLVGSLLRSWASAWEIAGWTRNVLWLGGGLSCVLGHNYPVYLRFRGGKGVATSLGVVLGVYPYLTVAGLLAFVVWAIVTLATRYVSAGSVAAAVALPFLVALCMWWVGCAILAENWPLLGFAGLAGGLVVYRHRANLARLRAGTEPKLGTKV